MEFVQRKQKFDQKHYKKYLMSGDLSKHQGIYIGNVVRSAGVLRCGLPSR
jgi:hypothetical protein